MTYILQTEAHKICLFRKNEQGGIDLEFKIVLGRSENVEDAKQADWILNRMNSGQNITIQERGDGVYMSSPNQKTIRVVDYTIWPSTSARSLYSTNSQEALLKGSILIRQSSELTAPVKLNFENQHVEPLKGWICPVCGAGLSPFTTRCSCTPFYTPSYPVYPYYQPWFGIYPPSPTPVYCSTGTTSSSASLNQKPIN